MCMCFMFSFTIYNFYYISYFLYLSYLFDNKNMTDDKVPHSRTGRGPTRLKSMSKKINDGKKIPLSIEVNTGVATRPYAKNFSS